jgi:YidC/Oxa1 family membrane protein insertase
MALCGAFRSGSGEFRAATRFMLAATTPSPEDLLDRNVILAFALSMVIFSGWLAWQEKVQGPQRQAEIERRQAAAEAAAELGETEASQAVVRSAAEPRAAASDTPAREDTAYLDAAGEASARVVPALWTGSISNDEVHATFTNRGAALVGWRLSSFYETPSREVNVELIDLPEPNSRSLVTSFHELGLGDLGDEIYEVERATDAGISFVLRQAGVVIRKSYALDTEQPYGFRLDIEVENGTDRVLSPRFEVVWPAAINDRNDFKELSLVALGGEDEVTRELVPGIGSPGFFSKIFGNGDDGPITARDIKWAGIDLRYFTGVLLPDEGVRAHAVFEPLEKGRVAAAVVSQEPAAIAPGETLTRGYSSYLGPKDPRNMAAFGRELDRAVNAGFSWIEPLTRFFGWALHTMYGVVPNYGLAIILITVLVRLGTWPIMARQMKSAERMRELMPRIKELQEKYKDDKQKQSEETFKLYRETGVNPLGGCLPMVLQLPVFIGLFYALQSSFDLRHAPFFLWINDLSAPATLFTLPGVDFPIRLMPLLMGGSMFVQQKMMPQTGMDPAQARMMLIMMPGMMLVISYTFPSGLVLYWTVSNVLGIAHQLWVRRTMQQAEPG